MKKIFFNLQKIALSALMCTGLMFAIANINVTCYAFSYQPKPPKALAQFKHLGND